MKSLAFLCLICAPNLYFAQKLLRGTKNCWVTRTAKSCSKVAKHNRDRPISGTATKCYGRVYTSHSQLVCKQY